MSARMVKASEGKLDSAAKFPFLGVLTTGGHTEFVLTRGVGLHTVIGFTIDIAVGSYLDRVASIFSKEVNQI